MTHSRGYTISYLSQQPEFDEKLTVLEQVFHGDTPLIRLLRDYEKALLNIEKIQVMKSTGTIICSAATYGCNECMGSKCKCEISFNEIRNYRFHCNCWEFIWWTEKHIAMAQCFIETPDLLILDEPTNHLDHETVEWLEEYLARYTGAVLLVTHDRYFLDRVTNRILN